MKRRRRRGSSPRTLNLVRDVPGAADRLIGRAAPTTAGNVRTIARTEYRALHRRSLVERISDATARWAGCSAALVFHVVFFAAWLAINTRLVPGVPAFDPFPFGLLTTIVSLEAIFLALFILISQNRMSRQAERRGHLDLQINLLAEQESTMALRLLRRLCDHAGMDLEAFDVESRELEKKTNIRALIDELDHKLPGD
ncbi:MAG: DUF1003 domain-containing protein [Candidatus Rokuibacteriota bacterium]